MSKFEIRKMQPEDWPAVRAIYLEGIATGNATFETDAPSWEAWDAGHLTHSRFIASDGTSVLGWGALSPTSRRQAYAGVAEISVYVGREHRGYGIGKALLQAMIQESEQNGIWTLQAGVFPENLATVALHKGCGFREIGRRERVSKLNAVWRDTVLLERRSATVGND
jgi:phosphinothricin acetyltransferase